MFELRLFQDDSWDSGTMRSCDGLRLRIPKAFQQMNSKFSD